MNKALLAYNVEFDDGQIYRKHEWHDDQNSANRRIKYLIKLNKQKDRTVKYKKFTVHFTTMQQIHH